MRSSLGTKWANICCVLLIHPTITKLNHKGNAVWNQSYLTNIDSMEGVIGELASAVMVEDCVEKVLKGDLQEVGRS